MKRFLMHLGIWLFVAGALSYVLDALITTGLLKTDIRKYAVWNDIYNGEIDADLLVVGSSRAWCGFNTYILDSLLDCNSYNLGFDGHPFDAQLVRYDTYRRFNSKPSVILLNTEFLSTLHNSAEFQYEREQFFPFIHDSVLIGAFAKAKHISWLERHVPLLRYFGYREDMENGIKSFFGKKVFFDGGMHKGFRGNNFEWNRASLEEDTIRPAEIDWDVVPRLDGFVRRSSDEGIKVIFVKSPVYRPLMDHFSGIPVTDSIFTSIADRYHIPILDYYYSPIGLDSANFCNPSHLNAKGAELFTTELCRDLKDIL